MWRSHAECQAFLDLVARPLLALELVPEERQVKIIKTIAWVDRVAFGVPLAAVSVRPHKSNPAVRKLSLSTKVETEL